MAETLKNTEAYQNLREYRKAVKTAQEAAKSYYDEDALKMDDATYDELLRKITKTEEVHPEWRTGNLTSSVAGGVAAGGEVIHVSPMLSLENAMGMDDLGSWYTRLVELVGKVELCVEPKLDGLAISARYEDGKLVQVATRGDGKSGEDVTEKARLASGLPSKIKKSGRFEVRGEIYMTDQDFKDANELRADGGKDLFKNPRNAAAGVLRGFKDEVKYPLSFAAYDVLDSDKHHLAMQELEKLGFKTARKAAGLKDSVHVSYESVADVIEDLGKRRGGLGFAIDGAVVKVAERSNREAAGSTAKAPRWAIAYKYPADARMTSVLDIVVQVGRTGVLTPVAILEPVDVGGVTIKKTTLSNPSEVARKDVRINDTVWVRRAGEVIPEIVAVELSKRPKNAKAWKAPGVCPRCCGEIDTSSKRWRCTNKSCGLPEAIKFFAGRDAMDIDGLGKWIVKVLVEDGSIQRVSDVYKLTQKDLAGKLKAEPFYNESGKLVEPRISKELADKLLEAIKESKNRPVEAVICALGIGMVGRKLASNLVSVYPSLQELLRATYTELCEIEGIGEARAEQIVSDLSEMREVIEELISEKVGKTGTKISTGTGPLVGKTVVITGSIEGLDRRGAEESVKKLGGKVSSSVSLKTDLLIYGESAGSKFEKAKTLKVNTMSGEDFLKLLAENS